MIPTPRTHPTTPGPTYGVLIGLITIQIFGNLMAGSFWLIYLVSPPQGLPFGVAVLVWLLAFGVAAIMVVARSTGRPVRARTSMMAGMVAVAVGHVSFVLLPPIGAILVAGIGFGSYVPAFWLPMNTLLVHTTHRGNRAGRLAGLTATFTTVAVVAPVLGGFIAKVAGYATLFAAGGAIVIANLGLARWAINPNTSFTFSLDLRSINPGTLVAILGQGGVDGLLTVATPLASFRFTSDSFELGLLFALFSLTAGVATVLLGRSSDRRRSRRMYLIVGPVLSVPACILAFSIRDLSVFAIAIGWLSITSAIAPSFIYTILVERMEESIATATISREFALDLGRTVAILAGLAILTVGGDLYALFLLLGGVILMEALAR
jgi:predicted MFS family arabinose efflux permease